MQMRPGTGVLYCVNSSNRPTLVEYLIIKRYLEVYPIIMEEKRELHSLRAYMVPLLCDAA